MGIKKFSEQMTVVSNPWKLSSKACWRCLTPQPKKCMSLVAFVHFITFFASHIGEARQRVGWGKRRQFLKASDEPVLYQALITYVFSGIRVRTIDFSLDSKQELRFSGSKGKAIQL